MSPVCSGPREEGPAPQPHPQAQETRGADGVLRRQVGPAHWSLAVNVVVVSGWIIEEQTLRVVIVGQTQVLLITGLAHHTSYQLFNVTGRG